MIQIENIAAGYNKTPVLEGFSLRAEAGECILLSGRNGSGKTTLMKTLAGLLPPLSGTLPGVRIVMVPTRIPKVKGFTVEAFIRTGCYQESDWRGRISKGAASRMEDALEVLGIRELRHRDVSTLSD